MNVQLAQRAHLSGPLGQLALARPGRNQVGITSVDRRYPALPSLLEGAGGLISSGVRGNWAAAAASGGRSS
jgi:hypothetical protein